MGNILNNNHSRNARYSFLKNNEEIKLNDLLKHIPENRNVRIYLEGLIDDNNNLKMRMKLLEDNLNNTTEKNITMIYNIEERIKLIQCDLISLVNNEKILLERITHLTNIIENINNKSITNT